MLLSPSLKTTVEDEDGEREKEKERNNGKSGKDQGAWLVGEAVQPQRKGRTDEGRLKNRIIKEG